MPIYILIVPITMTTMPINTGLVVAGTMRIRPITTLTININMLIITIIMVPTLIQGMWQVTSVQPANTEGWACVLTKGGRCNRLPPDVPASLEGAICSFDRFTENEQAAPLPGIVERIKT